MRIRVLWIDDGETLAYKEVELCHVDGELGIYQVEDYYSITTLSGFGVAKHFRCLDTAKTVIAELLPLGGWNMYLDRQVKLHGKTSYKYSNAADFAYLWSATAEEFKAQFERLVKEPMFEVAT